MMNHVFDRRVAKHTPGPWMCLVGPESLDADFRVLEHVETAIAIHAERWENQDDITADDWGYSQPNDRCDISERKVANARLIAAAPELLSALHGLLTTAKVVQALNEELRKRGINAGGFDDTLLSDAEAAIAKALGE